MATRGIRNNNPGNIVQTKPRTPWNGRVPDAQLTDPRFEQFVAPEYGIRALAMLLIAYQDWHGCDTIRQVIDRWAPPVENDTEAYIRSVSAHAGVAPDDPVHVHDYAVMRPIVLGIITQENGSQPFSDAMIDRALMMAGVVKPGVLACS